MLRSILLISAFLAALVMGLALAHALEMPGKMRLDRERYYVVQTIYYPGFTIAGMAEPLAILTTAAAVLIGRGEPPFWLIAGALIALVLTQVLFWLVVQPVNRQWLASAKLSDVADRFFRIRQAGGSDEDWIRLRDRWEWGHLARALTAATGFVLLLLAMASGR
jgi:hypothetical protein